jgi:hypothetical protein
MSYRRSLKSANRSGRWVARLLQIGALLACTGCATWHDDLMTNEQLIQANCSQLAIEDAKLADNAEHLSQASTGSGVGGAFLAVLEGVAGAQSGTEVTGESASQQARMAEEMAEKSRLTEERRTQLRIIQAKRGCL